MVRVQLLTGCRAGEVMAMRGRDLTPGAPVWEYRPRGPQERLAGQEPGDPARPEGPGARPGVPPAPTRARTCSAPAGRGGGLHAPPAAGRTSKPTPSECRDGGWRAGPGPGTPAVRPAATTGQAIVRACRTRPGCPRGRRYGCGTPAATAIRRRYGLEAAQSVLGHARADVTQVYAEGEWASSRGHGGGRLSTTGLLFMGRPARVMMRGTGNRGARYPGDGLAATTGTPCPAAPGPARSHGGQFDARQEAGAPARYGRSARRPWADQFARGLDNRQSSSATHALASERHPGPAPSCSPTPGYDTVEAPRSSGPPSLRPIKSNPWPPTWRGSRARLTRS